jgi:hypothetical protein
MLKTLAWKELRETAGIVAIALAFYLYFAVRAMRYDLLERFALGYLERDAIPFVGGSFVSTFTWVSVALTIALGLRQSIGESVHGTWMFLLHRPTVRTRLIGTKLLVGAVVYLVVGAAAILAYAGWAATPGHHASPFQWAMTVPVWKIWITMPIVYLAAFLSGIRPARWVGTRLLPLAAAGSMAAFIPGLRWWPVCGLGLIVLSSIVLVSSIFYLAQSRDF